MKIVILAGGKGSRLWPLSRQEFPKQFLHFGQSYSLLQRTALRFLKRFSAQDLLFVTNQQYYHLVRQQIEQIDPQLAGQILIEPEQRNTAPAICLALKYLLEKTGMGLDDCFLVASSDHLLSPEEQFLSQVTAAEEQAERGFHLLFGVRPTQPEIGYGYIHYELSEEASCPVRRFVEKPSYERATEYLFSGNYLWNTGIFLFHAKTFLEDLKTHQPSFEALFHRGLEEFFHQFHTLPEQSIDYALLEFSTRIRVVPLEIAWSDIGSWDGLYETFSKDDKGNVIQGNVLAKDTHNCLLMSEKQVIATVGVEDLLVISSDDALLIAKRGASQKVKELVDQLKLQGSSTVSTHKTVHRPWGQYTVLEEGERYKIKRIAVDSGQKLSLQLHYHRSEHWVVVQGTAKVTLDDKETLLHENESIYVPKSTLHRLENPGKVALEIIEVQVGEYVGEDDIVRFDDVYGRAVSISS